MGRKLNIFIVTDRYQDLASFVIALCSESPQLENDVRVYASGMTVSSDNRPQTIAVSTQYVGRSSNTSHIVRLAAISVPIAVIIVNRRFPRTLSNRLALLLCVLIIVVPLLES